MEPAREIAWAEHEKVYLLAEILKASPVPTHVLYGLLREYNVQPRWNDIALPHGRSLRSCQMAFNEISATYPATEYRRPPPQAQQPAPTYYPGPEIPKKRPLQHEGIAAPPMGRLLQPRPPHSFPDQFLSGPAYSSAMSPVGEPANKKKRGRPTKAEAQQRAQEAAARGEVYPPPRRSRPSVSSLEQSQGEPGAQSQTPQGELGHQMHTSQGEMRSQRPSSHGEMVAQMQTPPGAAGPPPPGVITPQQMTPQQMHTDLPQESSSGKKKRTKPHPLELEKTQRPPGETGSPLAYGSASGELNRPHAYSTFTPISAPLPSSSEPRDRDTRMEGVEETHNRTATPHSFKDTVGI